MKQLSLFDMPKVKVGRRNPVWDKDTDSIIGYASYLMCEKCGTVLGCRFTYREDIYYTNECPNCNRSIGSEQDNF